MYRHPADRPVDWECPHCREVSLTTDWTNRPLLNETNRFGVNGIDLGANTEHNGRLYIFFGDVAIDGNPDAVCWTTETVVQRNGGHLAIGWDSRTPNNQQGATETTGQLQWRLCAKCHGLFFCPSGTPAECAGRATRTSRSAGPLCCPTTTRAQPTRPAGGTGGRATSTRVWAPGADPSRTVCAAGGQHRVPPPGSWVFFLPALQTSASDAHGQPGCHERRSLRLVAAQHAITVQSWCIEPLSITTCGGEVRVRELICRVEREGWVVRLRSGGHLELSHPRAARAVITSTTPSDWRWLRNLRAQMRRALPPEPKPERTVRHARSKRPLQQRPPQQQPKRPAPVVAAVERLARPRPSRRLAGGPAGYYSPWSAWW